MGNIFFIIFIPLCVAGAIAAVYSTFKLFRVWKTLGGEEIIVSAVAKRWGLVRSSNNLSAAVRLLDDKILFKMFPLSLVDILKGNPPAVELQSISKVIRKKGIIMPLLRIYTTGKLSCYVVYANDATLDKIVYFLLQHNIQVE